jgi:hypothetical protein
MADCVQAAKPYALRHPKGGHPPAGCTFACLQETSSCSCESPTAPTLVCRAGARVAAPDMPRLRSTDRPPRRLRIRGDRLLRGCLVPALCAEPRRRCAGEGARETASYSPRSTCETRLGERPAAAAIWRMDMPSSRAARKISRRSSRARSTLAWYSARARSRSMRARSIVVTYRSWARASCRGVTMYSVLGTPGRCAAHPSV